MARALDRFRVLPLADAPAEPARTTPGGDLFEHYGVPIDARAPTRPRPVVEVSACRHCGWLREREAREPCPICATPASESSESSEA
ncbi:hypothetical protein ACNOYE_33195 [Nannocystaceae bacterium ST9]